MSRCLAFPRRPSRGAFQLKYLKAAVESFAERLRTHNGYHVAVIRSTVPPGTTRKVMLPLIERISGKKAGQDFGLVMQPEFLREITANQDFERPWFILIGEFDAKAGNVIDKLYRNFDAPIQHCSLDEAEFQKYVNNIFNAVKIAFFNEMRVMANHEGWDAGKIFRAVAESCEGMWNPLYGTRDMGPFDGACLPKDITALVEWAHTRGYEPGIIKAVLAENLRHEEILGKNTSVKVNHLEKVRA